MRRAIVAGTGSSLAPWVRENLTRAHDPFTVFGVNTIDATLNPDHLVLVNDERDFDPQRLEVIEGTSATCVWIARGYNWTGFYKRPLITVRRFAWRTVLDDELPDFNDDRGVPCHLTSTYAAMMIALRQGFDWIGLIGVDLENHPTLAAHFDAIDAAFGHAVTAAQAKGREVYNLSPRSRLTGVPRLEWPA